MNLTIKRLAATAAAGVALTGAAVAVEAAPAAAKDACMWQSDPGRDWYDEQGTGRYENWHPVLKGPWGTKTARLMNGHIQDDSYGEFVQGFNPWTDLIWIDYRRPGTSDWVQCGPRNTRRSPHVDTYDPVQREVRVCIATEWKGVLYFDCADLWWTDRG